MNNRPNRGSEWSKWDLHIHTPFSVLNNGFGNDWDNYVIQLFRTAIAQNVQAIGITDYFSIDGYKKLMTEYLRDENKMAELFAKDELAKIKEILILPNVEFRLKKFVGTNRINFHVIFSNEVLIEDIEENFLHELDFVYEAAPQTEDEKRKLKTRNLEDLGRKLKQQHPPFQDRSDLIIGMINAVVVTNKFHRFYKINHQYLKISFLFYFHVMKTLVEFIGIVKITTLEKFSYKSQIF